jgi:hypothetical protein
MTFEFSREIEPDSFWVQSGLHLLWNRLFPRLSLKVTLPSWSICECNLRRVLDGVKFEVVSVVFTPDATVLELEFTALDEQEGPIKIHPWNTTIDLRKCVNKNLRVSQIEKVASIELDPGESRRVYTAYRAFKLSSRLRWIEVFVSISRGQGQFLEDKLRIPYETLTDSLDEESITELDNVVPQFVNMGLLIVYVLSFFMAVLVSAPLRYFELAWYYSLLSFAVVTPVCAMLLRWQFIQALAEIGYRDRLSVRALYGGDFYSAFDPAARSKAKRRRVSNRVRDYLWDRGA